jgi:hypothetical protein
MRSVFALLPVLLLSAAPARAGDLRSRLLSDRAALVAPETAPEVTAFLSEAWDALICVPGGFTAGTATDRWPIVNLPAMPPDPQAASDSLAAWRDAYGISVVFSPGSTEGDGWSKAASVDGLALYLRVSEFRKGDFALPVGTGYEIYRGPAGPIFPSRISRLEMLRLNQISRGVSRADAELLRLGDAIDASFRGDGASDRAAVDLLLDAAEQADALGKSSDSAVALAQIFGRRWGNYAGWLLTPEVENTGLELFSGIAREGTVAFRSNAPVEVNLRPAAPGRNPPRLQVRISRVRLRSAPRVPRAGGGTPGAWLRPEYPICLRKRQAQ